MPEVFGQLPVIEPAWTELQPIQTVEKQERKVLLTCGNAVLSISVLAENLIRVRLSPSSEFLPRRSWAVAQEDNAWSVVPFEIEETADQVQIKTSQIRVEVDRQTRQITCFDKADRPFAQDIQPIAWRESGIAAWKHIETEEHFYGFGERTGFLDKRSQAYTNWTVDSLDYHALTDEMYQAIPFFIALRPQLAYGLFLNSTFWSRFDIGAAQAGVWQIETQSPELDYYIIYGPAPAQILTTYTALTGRMPLPPKWAIGYHQCRWSYASEDEVRELTQTFRQKQIPCDVIHLDIDYMRDYRVFTWHPDRFPNPKQLLSDLKQNGFQTVTIVDPGVKLEYQGNYAVFNDGLEKECFVRTRNGNLFQGYVWPDRAVFPDFMRADVRQWWASWHKELTAAGVAGIWNDMNEPAMNDRPFGDPGVKIWFPLDTAQGGEENSTHAETHNLYGMMMARAACEAMQQLRPNERSFILTRSGYAGIQQYSAVWTGDNHSRWEYLEMSLPMLCNLGLSGVAFVGADIGGFAGNATAELFARWMQMGMLYPLMRAHSILKSMRHEPWVFGARVEQICRQYIELRYQLLPYFYTLFWQAATTGAPILRPLLYDFPNDPQTYELANQAMLGSAILAAPIDRPGQTCRVVYLPEGTWFDWWTGQSHRGNTHILADAPLETMPLFVRAGSILPMMPVMQYANETPLTELRLKIWQGEGEFTLYEDDGRSFAYQQGDWATTTYRVYSDSNQTIVTVQARQGQWQPHPRRVIVELVGVGEQSFEEDGSDRRLVF
ncbi:glycoside hydrolase family 31 protein [Leptolyngbya sp. FACHB-711]|uniref:glycoside hydrolase family 31 protein n=1 Tax=Leptolyngbya sp. FACHB-711 TaxID=2692813 RepID=UPI0016854B26|nr:glycoside hydrolase family 31 protein [Leptolyngbya sp. FACHB-711]MBD1853109.1 glycoside hydrolase family 31 protein [Cyanobacteria bacterium FACHB-502]MBD2023621.1 glycoside hydrolase family 31 protein [Leptolyngbya sp. FACHB-711]